MFDFKSKDFQVWSMFRLWVFQQLRSLSFQVLARATHTS